MASSDDVEKHMKKERDLHTSTLILFKSKNLFFIRERGGGSREGGRGAGV